MIYRFENVFPFVDHDKIYRYALQSFYKIGWEDSDDLDKKRYPSLHSTYNDNDIKYLNIIELVKPYMAKTKYKHLCKPENINTCVVNLTKPSDPNFLHTHHGNVSCLYYPNMKWDPDWAGETVIYDKQVKDIKHSNAYKPNSLLIFDGDYPHTIRAQNYTGPSYRFTLALLFRKETQQ